jgi:hypothetical protein
MFQRAGVTVSEFYEQTGGKIPDFALAFGSIKANVEAKLLTTSDVEETLSLLCPRSDKENLRAESRVKDAAHQLVSDETSGILSIGLRKQQDPLAIRDRLLFNFARGKFSSVSSVALSLSGTHLEAPRRSVVDL